MRRRHGGKPDWRLAAEEADLGRHSDSGWSALQPVLPLHTRAVFIDRLAPRETPGSVLGPEAP